MARVSRARKALCLQEALKSKNYDPLAEVIRIATSHNTKQELRLKIAMELIPYLYAKKKAVEMDVSAQPVTFNFDLTGKRNDGNEVQNTEAEAYSPEFVGDAAA